MNAALPGSHDPVVMLLSLCKLATFTFDETRWRQDFCMISETHGQSNAATSTQQMLPCSHKAVC
jgi:hypothetical protein